MQARGLLSVAAGLLRTASLLVCLVAVIWFVVFATGQAGVASANQADEIATTPNLAPVTAAQAATDAAATAVAREAAVAAAARQHSSLDQVKRGIVSAGNAVAKPFEGVTGSDNAWVQHGVALALVLALYGVGAGFLLRWLRLVV